MDWIQTKLFGLLLAAVPVGLIAVVVMQYVKKGSTWVENLSPMLKRGAVVVIAAALTALGTWLKVPIVCSDGVNCLASLDQQTVEALIKAVFGAVLAMLAHAGKKKAEKLG